MTGHSMRAGKMLPTGIGYTEHPEDVPSILQSEGKNGAPHRLRDSTGFVTLTGVLLRPVSKVTILGTSVPTRRSAVTFRGWQKNR